MLMLGWVKYRSKVMKQHALLMPASACNRVVGGHHPGQTSVKRRIATPRQKLASNASATAARYNHLVIS
jgi:hypothetical protein